MIQQIGNEAEQFIELSKQSFPLVLLIVGIVWVINIINWVSGKWLYILGLFPRKWYGLPGIIFSPLLHGGFTHLFFNSFPFIALSTFILNRGMGEFLWATGLITFLSGLGVWLFARPGNHVGASSLIAGYFTYVLILAYEQPSFISIFCAGIAIYYFSGILLSFIPSEESTSWEGHLAGLLSGGITVWLIHFNPFFLIPI